MATVVLLSGCKGKIMAKRSFTSLLCGLFLSGALVLPAGMQARQEGQHAPDNTAANKQDRSSQEPTADRAKNNLTDRELMRHIRQEVIKDKTISTYGHNVKIIADHGKVTLKGPVRSDEEKQAIREHARKYAAEEQIDDQLAVKVEQK